MRTTQRGVALISILIVVVLISALAFQLYSHQRMATAQTRLALESTQMREWLLAGESFAVALLTEDWKSEDTQLMDTLAEPWSQSHEVVPDEHANVYVRILDSSARFNINSVAGPAKEHSKSILLRLVESLSLGGSPKYVAVWRDWVDQDDIRYIEQGFFGREDLDWLSNTPPFRTANSLAADLSEFRMISSLDTETFVALQQLATVLPTQQLKINVNTASADVLNLLLEAGSPSLPSTGSIRTFESVDSFVEKFPEFKPLSGSLATRSEFFEVHTTAESATNRMDMTSHLWRDLASGEVDVYGRSFGVRHSWTLEAGL